MSCKFYFVKRICCDVLSFSSRASNFVDLFTVLQEFAWAKTSKLWFRDGGKLCPLKNDIFTLNAPISANEVSMFRLAIEVYSKTKFGLIHAMFLSLGSTKSAYFIWDTR